jgi:hypothetical protein
MKSKIFKKIIENWMMILPLTSAGASFILSFWLKMILTPEDYGDFATVFFTVTVLLGLGIVGYDQVIIRLSKLTEHGLEVDKWLVNFGILVLILTPGISFLLLSSFGVVDEFTIDYLIVSWSAACLSVLAILFNLQGRLLEGYLFLGSWKVVLLVMVVVLYIGQLPMQSFNLMVLLALVSTFFWFVAFRRPIAIRGIHNLSKTKVVMLYASSVVSLVSYKIFDGMDRFLLVSNFDKVVFGDYFFVFNFLLAPTSIPVSYYAVKRLKKYKEGLSLRMVLNDYFLIMSATIAITAILLFLMISFERLGVIEYQSIDMISLVGIASLCATRNGYVVLSTAYKVVASKVSLLLVASVFGFSALLIYYVVSGFGYELSLKLLVFAVLVMWIFRSAFYFYVLDEDLKKLKNRGS